MQGDLDGTVAGAVLRGVVEQVVDGAPQRARAASSDRGGAVHSFVKQTFAEGSSRHGRYNLELGAARGCHGATACFIASFSGVRGGTPGFKRTVSLAREITGYFQPVRGGAR